VDQAERFAGVVDDAHAPEFRHDLAHRSARSVHVAHDGDESLFIFFKDDAHAEFGRVPPEARAPQLKH
jgi:hypothetical protein